MSRVALPTPGVAKLRPRRPWPSSACAAIPASNDGIGAPPHELCTSGTAPSYPALSHVSRRP